MFFHKHSERKSQFQIAHICICMNVLQSNLVIVNFFDSSNLFTIARLSPSKSRFMNHRGATVAARATKPGKTPIMAAPRRCRHRLLFFKIEVRPRSCRSYHIWRPWIQWILKTYLFEANMKKMFSNFRYAKFLSWTLLFISFLPPHVD